MYWYRLQVPIQKSFKQKRLCHHVIKNLSNPTDGDFQEGMTHILFRQKEQYCLGMKTHACIKSTVNNTNCTLSQAIKGQPAVSFPSKD